MQTKLTDPAQTNQPGEYLWKVSQSGEREVVDLTKLAVKSRKALVNVLTLNLLDFDIAIDYEKAKYLTRNIEPGTTLEYLDVDTNGDTKLLLRMNIDTLRHLGDILPGYKLIAKKVRGQVITVSTDLAVPGDEAI